MQIGIVTLYGEFNYGNRLQNYALQRALEKLGNEVISVVPKHKEKNIKNYIKKHLYKKNGKIKIVPFYEKIREKNIRNFTQKYITTTYYKSDDGRIPLFVNEMFDCFIVGSDQVWNPLFWGKDKYYVEAYNYFLEFAERKKKISYAASFGISELPEKFSNDFYNRLTEFRAISVREDAGAEIIKKLTHATVDVVVDPTMLLSLDEWRKVSRKGVTPKFEYIVTYFLGEQDEKLIEYINEIAANRGYKIINIMDKNCLAYYTGGPETFLSLIENAELCFTDSFHAVVFSIIFQTPFIVVERQHSIVTNMNSRINTLLRKFNLSERNNWEKIMDPFECNFDGVAKILEREQKKAHLFLMNSLDDINN